MNATTKPHRRHRLVLDLGADTLPDMCRALENLSLRLQMGQVSKGAWGSPSDGADYEYIEDPTMDRERYFAESDAWLASRRAAEAEP